MKFCGSEVTSKKEWDVWSSLSVSGLELKHNKMPSHKAEFALTHVSESKLAIVEVFHFTAQEPQHMFLPGRSQLQLCSQLRRLEKGQEVHRLSKPSLHRLSHRKKAGHGNAHLFEALRKLRQES